MGSWNIKKNRNVAGAVIVCGTIFMLTAMVGWKIPAFVDHSTAFPFTVRLWENRAPGALGDDADDIPSLAVYLPEKKLATGTGIVICPGGAYKQLMTSYEGEDIARWLNGMGIAGFVLSYRHAPRYKDPIPKQDVLRALRYVRFHHQGFGLTPDRIGVMGFSAGGHLAATASTQFDSGIAGSDTIDAVSSRPDFSILGYPIISLLVPFTYEPAVVNLLGPEATEADRRRMSADLHVGKQTPPAFLFHTAEDTAVPLENSLAYFSALRNNGIPAELHIYSTGPHGAGLANGVGLAPDLPFLASWSSLASAWLCQHTFIPANYCPPGKHP